MIVLAEMTATNTTFGRRLKEDLHISCALPAGSAICQEVIQLHLHAIK